MLLSVVDSNLVCGPDRGAVQLAPYITFLAADHRADIRMIDNKSPSPLCADAGKLPRYVFVFDPPRGLNAPARTKLAILSPVSL